MSILIVLAIVYSIATSHASALGAQERRQAGANVTADNSQLRTWWHDEGEINTASPVADGNVRQSHLYTIGVSTSGDDATYYQSFVYETIPGNGMTTDVDRYGETQAWTSFLYSAETTVRVARQGMAPGAIIVRPTNLGFSTSNDTDYTYITVPYSASGYRFSVEFQDDLQLLCPSGSEEPWNVLLVFASPMEDASLIPAQDDSALVVAPGRIPNLTSITQSTVYFGPGVYYATGTDHLNLSSSVEWVYFAPGAYVKGAVEYHSTAAEVKATGHGVLSGEQYVFYADPDNGYQNGGALNDGLRMWRGHNGDSQQTFTLRGVTINAPPFNSMDWDGNTDLVTTMASDYKQVGSYYGQTDGLEVYPGSLVQDIFYHVNDDTIKTYYSNVIVSNVVVWKLDVAPVVQFGWAPRDLSNITVDTINIIHQSYQNAGDNPALIGSDNNYAYTQTGISSNHHTADVSMTMQDVTWSNFRAEGPSACLFRIYALETLRNLTIDNFWIEEFEPSDDNTTQSLLPAFYDATSGEQVGVSNFVIKDFYVGDVKITADNAVSVGQIDVDSTYENGVVYQ